MALTSLANVKEYLGISGTTYDALLTNLITRMEAFIERYCDRPFAQTTYTDEKYDGEYNNGGLLLLNHWPLISVASLYDDLDCDYTSSTLIDSDDYLTYLDEGIIRLKNGVEFNEGDQNIKITYDAGVTSVPADLEQATIEMVAEKFNVRGSEGKKSEKLGRWGVTYITDPVVGRIAMSESVRAVLEAYKLRRMMIL
jgi:uncharacterized phiE125 gp8 family phage protein